MPFQQPQQIPTLSAEQDGLRLTPTRDPKSSTGVYIPKDLEDAFVELRRMLPAEILDRVHKGDATALMQGPLGMRMWLRNKWRLWHRSRLAKYFHRLGVRHADFISGILLTTFTNHVQGKPLRLQEQIRDYQTWERASKEPEDKRCPHCTGTIRWEGILLYDSPAERFRQTHMGICGTCKNLWAYEFDRGWFTPTVAMRLRWKPAVRKQTPAPPTPC
jgi:hypothetical protein